MNLLFIDDSIYDLSSFLNGIGINTKYVIYNTNLDNLDIIINNIQNLNITRFDNIAFVFSSNNYIDNKLFVDYKPFISYNVIENNEENQENEKNIIENEVTLFIKNIVNTYSVKYVDFLACNLLSNQLWKSYFEYIQNDNQNVITVRASSDLTGNLTSGGDWVLETTNEDISTIYFNENIEYWNYLLDTGGSDSSIFTLLTLDEQNNLYTAGTSYDGEDGRYFDKIFTNDFNIPNDPSKLIYSIYNKKVVDFQYFYNADSSNYQNCALLTDEPSNNLYVYCSTLIALDLATSMNINPGYAYEKSGWFTNVKYNTTIPLITGNKKIIKVAVGLNTIIAISDEPSNNVYVSGGVSSGTNRTAFSNTSIIALSSLLNKKVIDISTTGMTATGSNATSLIITDESSNNLYVSGRTCLIGHSTSTNSQTGSFSNKDASNNYIIPNKKIIKAIAHIDGIIALTDESYNNLYTTGSNYYGMTFFGQIKTNTYKTIYSNVKSDGTPIIDKQIIDIQINNRTIVCLSSDYYIYIACQAINGTPLYTSLTNTNITLSSLNISTIEPFKNFSLKFYSSTNSEITYYVINGNSTNNLYYKGYSYFAPLDLSNSTYNIHYSGLDTHINNTFDRTKYTSLTNNINGLSDKIVTDVYSIAMSPFCAVLTNDSSNNLYICGVNGTNRYIDCLGLKKRNFVNNIFNLTDKRVIKTFSTIRKTFAITTDSSNNLYNAGLIDSGIGSSIGFISNWFKPTLFTNKGYPGSTVSTGIMLNKKIIDAKTSSTYNSNNDSTFISSMLITNESSNNLYISSYSPASGIGNTGSDVYVNKRKDNNEYFIPNKKVISICNLANNYDTLTNTATNSNGSTDHSVLTSDNSNNLYVCGVLTPGLYGYGNTTSTSTITTYTNLKQDGTEIMQGKKIIKCASYQGHTMCITDENSNNLYVSGYNGTYGMLGINNNTTTYAYTFTNPYNTIENGIGFNNKQIIDIYPTSRGSICLTNDSSNNVYICGEINNQFLGLTTTANSYHFVSLTNQAMIKSSPLLPFIYNKRITNIQLSLIGYINYISDFRENPKNLILGRCKTTQPTSYSQNAGFIGYNYEFNFDPTRQNEKYFTDDVSSNMTQPFIDRSVYHSVQLSKKGFDNLYFGDNNAIYTPIPTDSISIINHDIINNINGILNASKYFTLDPIESYLVEHISFDISVSQYKNVEIYSRNYKNEIKLISSNNTINDDIYYTQNVANGLVKIYCKYFATIIIKMVSIPPSINTLNSNAITNVYDVSLNSIDSEIIYPDTSSNILNTINIKSTTPDSSIFFNSKIKGYLQLYPENTLLNKHISFNITIPAKRAISIYYKSNNLYYLIPKINTILDDDCYTYNQSNGLINIKTKKLKEFYVVEKEPIINVLSNDISNVNILTNASVIYNTIEDISNNLITISTENPNNNYNINKIKKYINLYPPNTTFTEHINFEINVESFKSYNIYFKSQNDTSPYLISKINNYTNDVYYNYNQTNGIVAVYTKHFSEVFISENEPNLQIINNSLSILSNFNIPINNSITYSNNEDTSNNIITLISNNSINVDGINKQLAYITMSPSNVSISGEHISYDISLSYAYKPINVYYKLYNDVSFTLINPLNNSLDDIYYIYEPSYGLIHIYSIKAIDLIVNENEPNINTINNNSLSILSNFNYNSNTIVYPNSQDTTNNTITCSSELVSNQTYIYNLKNIKSRVILEPHGTQFENHVSYKITLPNNKPIKVYFKNHDDINPIEISSSNTILNDVYYQYNQAFGIVTIYTKHFSESLVIQNESNQSINFYMQQFNYSITMTSGMFNAETPTISATDSVANFYMKTQDIRNIFMFKVDSMYIDDSISDIKYFVRMSLWPNNLVLNPCHACVQQHHQIASSDKYGIIPDNKQLVKHDFIRYISKELFNTHLGVDLFLNEDALKYDLAWKGHYKVWNDIKNTLHNVDAIDLSVNLFNESMYGIDPIYGKYLTKDASGNENLCRKLINQIMSVAPSRFQNLNDIAIDISNGYYYVPFMENDSISFILTLNPANNQHKLVNRNNPIPSRTYKIKINIKDDVVNSFNSLETSNVIVDDTSPSIYLGQPVTNNLNNSYPSNYTI